MKLSSTYNAKEVVFTLQGFLPGLLNLQVSLNDTVYSVNSAQDIMERSLENIKFKMPTLLRSVPVKDGDVIKILYSDGDPSFQDTGLTIQIKDGYKCTYMSPSKVGYSGNENLQFTSCDSFKEMMFQSPPNTVMLQLEPSANCLSKETTVYEGLYNPCNNTIQVPLGSLDSGMRINQSWLYISSMGCPYL
jgi:hypothetical protein